MQLCINTARTFQVFWQQQHLRTEQDLWSVHIMSSLHVRYIHLSECGHHFTCNLRALQATDNLVLMCVCRRVCSLQPLLLYIYKVMIRGIINVHVLSVAPASKIQGRK